MGGGSLTMRPPVPLTSRSPFCVAEESLALRNPVSLRASLNPSGSALTSDH